MRRLRYRSKRWVREQEEQQPNETGDDLDFWIAPDSAGASEEHTDTGYDRLTSVFDPKALVRASGLEPSTILGPTAASLLLQYAQENPQAMAALAAPLIPDDQRRIAYHKSVPQDIVERLRNTYTCFEFFADETQCVANPHDVGAVPRRAIQIDFYSRMCAYDVGDELDISDVGGNELISAKRETRVHYCRLVLDGKDAARVTMRDIELRKMERERPGIVDLFRPGGPRVCTRGVEKCTVRSPVCCEIHVYDITMEQRAEYFENKDVSLSASW